MIFAWNGSEMQFVSDCLGVAGVGFRPERTPWPSPSPGAISLPEDARPHVMGTGRSCWPNRWRKLTFRFHLDRVMGSAAGWSSVDERMGTGSPDLTGADLL